MENLNRKFIPDK